MKHETISKFSFIQYLLNVCFHSNLQNKTTISDMTDVSNPPDVGKVVTKERFGRKNSYVNNKCQHLYALLLLMIVTLWEEKATVKMLFALVTAGLMWYIKFYNLQNSRGYLKNHRTNNRLDSEFWKTCTQCLLEVLYQCLKTIPNVNVPTI